MKNIYLKNKKYLKSISRLNQDHMTYLLDMVSNLQVETLTKDWLLIIVLYYQEPVLFLTKLIDSLKKFKAFKLVSDNIQCDLSHTPNQSVVTSSNKAISFL